MLKILPVLLLSSFFCPFRFKNVSLNLFLSVNCLIDIMVALRIFHPDRLRFIYSFIKVI